MPMGCLAEMKWKSRDSSQSLYTIFMEKLQDKGKGIWASRGSKLWAGKYTWTLMEDKVNLVVCYAALGW